MKHQIHDVQTDDSGGEWVVGVVFIAVALIVAVMA